jgi:hypothetical protein
MTAELKIAVERLYEVFAVYPANPNMIGSPLLEDLPKMNSELTGKPLRSLTSGDLFHFLMDVMYTWGDTPDFKHFLPRILELTALRDSPDYEIGLISKKLELTEWSFWPPQEYEAVLFFYISLWKDLMQEVEPEIDQAKFMDYFSGIATICPDFRLLLMIWEQYQDAIATRYLAGLIYYKFSQIFEKGALRGYYIHVPVVPTLIQWLCTDRVINRLTDAFFMNQSDDNYAEILSFAVRVLEFEKSKRTASKN